MSNKIIDLCAHRNAKARESEELREQVAALLECRAILANAIDEMWSYADRGKIMRTIISVVAGQVVVELWRSRPGPSAPV